MGKGENNGYQYYLFLPQCPQKPSFFKVKVECDAFTTQYKIMFNNTKKMDFCKTMWRKYENIVGKGKQHFLIPCHLFILFNSFITDDDTRSF